MEKVYYIGSYGTETERGAGRYFPDSAVLKMNGIIEELKESGYRVEIISLSQSHGGRVKGRYNRISNDVSLKTFTSFGRRNELVHLLDNVCIRVQSFFYLIKTVKKGDVVIFYHSYAYILLPRVIKWLKKFKLILELEEIYGDVFGDSKLSSKEISLADKADGYIFPTYLLDKKINKEKKPSVVIHGTYKPEKKVVGDEAGAGSADEKIHIVYAGTLDCRKGSIEAVKATEFLPSGYHIHILGSGSQKEIEDLEKEIEKTKGLGADVTYDGRLFGEDYIKFLQKCQLGLCTQDPEAAFTSTSFPSKILSYLSNGLRVLSIKIEAIYKSDVAPLLYFYDEQTPEKIAEAIKSIDFSKDYDSRGFLDVLFKKSAEQVGKLIDNVRMD